MFCRGFYAKATHCNSNRLKAAFRHPKQKQSKTCGNESMEKDLHHFAGTWWAVNKQSFCGTTRLKHSWCEKLMREQWRCRRIHQSGPRSLCGDRFCLLAQTMPMPSKSRECLAQFPFLESPSPAFSLGQRERGQHIPTGAPRTLFLCFDKGHTAMVGKGANLLCT